MLARLIAEDQTVRISSQGILNGDVNGSGRPDPGDIVMILQYIARIIDTL